MKGGTLDRTKVVIRHLPHNITQSALMDQIDTRFSGRYNWVSFRSGKNSLKSQSYSRAYIDFKQPEDVIEFADFFNGHVFVNEKGTQCKAIVEYAPSQRVPKQWSKKDGREGTIDKDPQYLEFLELLAKPVENLPSAEVQLERKEAERAGTAKEAPIVTPLMDFVRQKRAAKGGPRRALPNGKLARRTSGASSSGLKRGSERRTSTTMYVPRDSGKSRGGKEKSTYRDGQQLSEKPGGSSSVSGSVVLEGSSDPGKKKILLLKGKGKEKEISLMSSSQQNLSEAVKLLHGPGGVKQKQEGEGSSGRMIRSILVKKQNQSEEQQQNQPPNTERRPPPAPAPRPSNGLPDDKRRTKDRPDRGVWTPLRRSDDSNSHSTEVQLDFAQGGHGEVKNELSSFARSGSGRGGHFLADNGSHKHGGRRGASHNVKDADSLSEGKPVKRGVASGYEKQVWVQKSSSGP